MMNISLALDFPHDYEVIVQSERSIPDSSMRHYYFPGSSELGGHDGILVKVTPDKGIAWLGTFAYGYRSGLALNLVASCPDRGAICVVSSGMAMIVPVTSPVDQQVIDIHPVMGAYSLVNSKLLVFIGFDRIIALGPTGIEWKTRRLSWDGLRISKVTQTTIHGFAWDSPNNGEVEFTVDLQTGYTQGGASPDDVCQE